MSKIMLQTLCVTGLASGRPYGRVTLSSSIGELSTELNEDEIKAIVNMCDAASVRAAEKALSLLTPIVEAGTTQLVIEHQTQPGAFDDDIPF